MPNLDEVLFELKLIHSLPSDREKGRVYRELFPVNNGETDKEQVQQLKKAFESSSKTNMEKFIEQCLKYL